MDFPKKGQQKNFPKILLLKGMKSILTTLISVPVMKKNICWLYKVWPFTVIFKSTVEMDPNAASSLSFGMYAWFFYFYFWLLLFHFLFHFRFVPFSCHPLSLREVAKC